MSELPKTYDPKAVEDKLYSFWNDSGCPSTPSEATGYNVA